MRAFCHGRKPGRECKKGGFDLYDGLTREGKAGGRYLTLTGHHVEGTPTTINERQEQIDAVYRLVWPSEEQGPAGGSPPLDDAEIIRLATAARNGDKFKRLWAGDVGGYASDSEADLALVGILAFYTQDENQLDRLFRRSNLYRDKWDRRDYRDRTIRRALQRLRKTYTPRRGRKGAAANGTGDGSQPDDDRRTGYELILEHLQECYRPTFRRGSSCSAIP